MASSRSTTASLGGPRQLGLGDWADRLARVAEAQDLSGQAHGLACVVLALMGIGLIVQASFTATVLEPAAWRAEMVEHLLFRLAALSALFCGYVLGPSGVRRSLAFLTLSCGVLLVLCYVPGIGIDRNGSNRWVSVLGVAFQPSELARVVVVLWIADRCVRLGRGVYDLVSGVLPMLGLGLVFFLLILGETDLGGALLFLICVLSTMWVGGARPLPMTMALVTVGGGALTLMCVAIPYVRQRVAMFLGQVENAQVTGTTQALEDGGFLGRGLAQGRARLEGVPYLESDYVFAQIGEELGLFGTALVLGLLLSLCWFSVRLVLSIPGKYEALAAFGLLLSVALQAMLHVQVVAGLAPPKGMTLPFVSDGGTSLVVSSLSVGLALGAARRSRSRALP
jgi:cell division protein FtsW